MAGHGEKEGTIAQEEREMIERIFAINDLTVRDVMTPQGQVFSLEGNQTVRDVVAEVMEESYTRIPIYLEQPDEIHSILYLRDVLDAVINDNLDAKLKDISHEPEFVPEHQPIGETIATLRQRSRHMAVVVDEYGTIRGVVTLEDLMEELVGEIYDETDIAPVEMSQVSDEGIQVVGTAELKIVEDFFEIDLPGKHTDTINHWILSDTERIPGAGEIFNIDGLRVTVRKASKRRIEQVFLERDESYVPPQEEEDSLLTSGPEEYGT